MSVLMRTLVLLGIVALNFSAVNLKTHEDIKPGNNNPGNGITQNTAKESTNGIAWLSVPNVVNEGWDTMPEIIFWRRIVSLPKDSSVANVYASRKLLKNFSRSFIDSLEVAGKLEVLRNELALEYKIPAGQRIMFTSGRKWFYNFANVQDKIGRGMQVFDSLGVDPFYAQTVLLIESPGSNKQKSIAGAYGHFQIMPFNARKYGLRIDNYVDERENFDRSAYVSAMLFKETFIPLAKRWCNELGFNADENALWFKLLVMHCYNAGPYGVKSAMQQVPNYYQGNKLIHRLWHTTAKYFPSEAQNYSQLAVACYLEFEKQLADANIKNTLNH